MSALFKQMLLDVHDELIVDLFAGGGGASSGIEEALGRQVDIAINHDGAAVELHKLNHPQTMHHVSDVFEVDPRLVTQGRPIGLLWASPDCTYHSKARGGKPIRSKLRKRRALAWVVTRWAGQVRPRVIMLENVEEFADWGPLVGPPDALRPCRKRRGRSFKKWVRSLERHGYDVAWRELRACDYGAPTIRKRFFLIARCDGKPIVWPEATHGPGKKPYRTAAECIDWSIPMLSIFATKDEAKMWGKLHGQAAPIRPLAENTMRRIARGVKRYVLDNPKPFLVRTDMTSAVMRNGVHNIDEPVRTQTTGGSFALVSPSVAGVGGRAGQSPERSIESPLGTITGKADAALIAPFAATIAHGEGSGTSKRRGQGVRDLEQPHSTVQCSGDIGIVAPVIVKNNHGEKPFYGPDEPAHTIVAGGTHHAVVSPYLVPRYGEREGQEPRCRSVEEPAPVIVPDGNGGSLAAVHLSTTNNSRDPLYGADEPANTIVSDGARHTVVAANLGTYYGACDRVGDLDESLRTQSTENRHALVASFLAQNNAASARELGRDIGDPLATIAANGSGHHGLVASSMVKLKGTSTDANPADPLDTVNAGGLHHGVVATHVQRDFGQSVGSATDEPVGTVTPNGGGKAALVASFIQKYYGSGGDQSPDSPLHTIPTVDRFGFVTVTIDGQAYFIDDIAMRMLQPRELYNAQGFRTGYVIDRGADGRKLTKTEQVRMVGNSVCPPVARALARANCADLIARKEVRSA